MKLLRHMDPIIFVVEDIESVLMSQGSNSNQVELRLNGYIENNKDRPTVNIIWQFLGEEAKSYGNIILSGGNVAFVRASLERDTIGIFFEILRLKSGFGGKEVKIFITPVEDHECLGKLEIGQIDFYFPFGVEG